MCPNLKLTILVDNRARPGLVVEHGFSVWVEAGGAQILFDTGQGTALAHNAAHLEVDLGSAQALVISHGHYDHTGGVAAAVQRAPCVTTYAHPGILRSRFSVRAQGVKSIGLPDSARFTLQCEPSGRVKWTTTTVEIAPGVMLSGPIPRVTSYEDAGGPFFFDGEATRPDPIEDELCLWVVTPRGLVVLMGCGHAGVINTLQHARATSGVSRVHAVVGGLHLLEAGPQRIEPTLRALAEIDPELVIPAHCTGDEVIETLRQTFGRRVQPGEAGMVLELGLPDGSVAADVATRS